MDEGHAEDASPGERPPIAEQVGLAMRARRRELGLSQRAYAEESGLHKSTVARLESRAGRVALDDLSEALDQAGYELVVVPRGTRVSQPAWCATDLVARTRGGSRFAAHHEVWPAGPGPGWWWVDELWRRNRRRGPQPEWTTEGARGSTRLRLADTYGYGDPPEAWGRGGE